MQTVRLLSKCISAYVCAFVWILHIIQHIYGTEEHQIARMRYILTQIESVRETTDPSILINQKKCLLFMISFFFRMFASPRIACCYIYLSFVPFSFIIFNETDATVMHTCSECNRAHTDTPSEGHYSCFCGCIRTNRKKNTLCVVSTILFNTGNGYT